jgi:RNA polymerase sigma-70 factor (ECF subfamily)
MGIVGTTEAADDVLQDAYIKLIEAARTAEVRHSLAYCFQAVRNLALDCRRRCTFEEHLLAVEDEGANVPAAQATPEQYAINRQNLAIIDAALARLPMRTRQVFEMYRVGGLTQRDIAQRMSVSVGLVNGMIRDATNALMTTRHLLARE